MFKLSHSSMRLIVFPALLLAAFGAQAIPMTITQTNNFLFDATRILDFGGGGVGIGTTDTQNQSLNFAGFDTSLGTLQNVQVSFTSNWQVRNTIGAESLTAGGSASGTAQSDIDLTVDLVTPNGGSSTFSPATLSDNCGPAFFGCFDSSTDGGIFNGTLNLTGLTLNDFLAPVQVGLTRILTTQVTACDAFGAGSDFFCDAINDENEWSGNVTVEYTYDPASSSIPEPTSLALFALGLAGLGWWGRCQRQ